MVTVELISAKLDDLEGFFQLATELARNETDQETASYGLQKTLWMKEVLNNHKKHPKNSYLKQIHRTFFSVTRGVEGFDDKKINKQYTEAKKGIYEILNQLEKEIKW